MPVIVVPCLQVMTAERAFARLSGGEAPTPQPWIFMVQQAQRIRRLPIASVLGRHFPVAVGARARLLGLAGLDLEQAGPGLLIPRCRSIHTFGMCFALDLVFLDRDGRPYSAREAVPPYRVVWDRRADAVLELPASVQAPAR